MKKRKKKEKNPLYRFTMFVMCGLLCGLLYLINDKQHFITMSTLKQFQISDINQLFFWEKLLPDDEAVASEAKYQLLDNEKHTYTNGGNEVLSLFDAVIIKTTKTSVQVLCDNGVNVTYESMKEVIAKKDERVLAGTQLGTMEENVVIRFYLDDQEISMEEALKVK